MRTKRQRRGLTLPGEDTGADEVDNTPTRSTRTTARSTRNEAPVVDEDSDGSAEEPALLRVLRRRRSRSSGNVKSEASESMMKVEAVEKHTLVPRARRRLTEKSTLAQRATTRPRGHPGRVKKEPKEQKNLAALVAEAENVNAADLQDAAPSRTSRARRRPVKPIRVPKQEYDGDEEEDEDEDDDDDDDDDEDHDHDRDVDVDEDEDEDEEEDEVEEEGDEEDLEEVEGAKEAPKNSGRLRPTRKSSSQPKGYVLSNFNDPPIPRHLRLKRKAMSDAKEDVSESSSHESSIEEEEKVIAKSSKPPASRATRRSRGGRTLTAGKQEVSSDEDSIEELVGNILSDMDVEEGGDSSPEGEEDDSHRSRSSTQRSKPKRKRSRSRKKIKTSKDKVVGDNDVDDDEGDEDDDAEGESTLAPLHHEQRPDMLDVYVVPEPIAGIPEKIVERSQAPATHLRTVTSSAQYNGLQYTEESHVSKKFRIPFGQVEVEPYDGSTNGDRVKVMLDLPGLQRYTLEMQGRFIVLCVPLVYVVPPPIVHLHSEPLFRFL